MAVETAEDVATLGRKVASAQGFDPRTPGFDQAAYGREARYALARGRNVPDPHEFVSGGPAPVVHHPAPGRRDEGRRVRIGRVEMRLSDEPPARNRPQHPRHAGERSSGRYRTRLQEQVAKFEAEREAIAAQGRKGGAFLRGAKGREVLFRRKVEAVYREETGDQMRLLPADVMLDRLRDLAHGGHARLRLTRRSHRTRYRRRR